MRSDRGAVACFALRFRAHLPAKYKLQPLSDFHKTIVSMSAKECHRALYPPCTVTPYTKPFDRSAAEYVVTRFRDALPVVDILDELYARGHVLPCFSAVDHLLAMNGMEAHILDKRPHAFVPLEERRKIVVPEAILQRCCAQEVWKVRSEEIRRDEAKGEEAQGEEAKGEEAAK